MPLLYNRRVHALVQELHLRDLPVFLNNLYCLLFLLLLLLVIVLVELFLLGHEHIRFRCCFLSLDAFFAISGLLGFAFM